MSAHAQDAAAPLLAALRANERVNEYLLQHLPDSIWDVKPEGRSGRTIAAMFSHMHNVRLMWLNAVATHATLPPKLERGAVTRAETREALAASHALLAEAVGEASRAGKLPNFSAGPGVFVGYIIAHDAHHRGQACMQARLLGAKFSDEVMARMWDWPRLAKEASRAV
jgi:uncharacterized damage-inducible protein DinB